MVAIQGDAFKFFTNWMGLFHEGREWLQRDEIQRSISLSMQNIMLAAKAMTQDSCPMIGFDIEKVAEHKNFLEDCMMGADGGCWEKNKGFLAETRGFIPE